MQTLANPQVNVPPTPTTRTARATIKIEGNLKASPIFDIQGQPGLVELAFECASPKLGRKQRGLPEAGRELIIVWCTLDQYLPLEKKLQKTSPVLQVEGIPQLATGGDCKPCLRVLCTRLSCSETSLFSGFINPITVTWVLIASAITILRLTAPVLVPIPFVLLLALVALYQAFELAGFVPDLLKPFLRGFGGMLVRFGFLLEIIWLVLVYATHSPLR